MSHSKALQHLYVAKSQIPNGGLGLYTTIPRKENDKIIPYEGKLVEGDPDDLDPNNHYYLEIGRNKFIDAQDKNSGVGRFSNTAKAKDRPLINNAKFTIDRRAGKAIIKASKKIPKNKEILTSYGRTFKIT